MANDVSVVKRMVCWPRGNRPRSPSYNLNRYLIENIGILPRPVSWENEHIILYWNWIIITLCKIILYSIYKIIVRNILLYISRLNNYAILWDLPIINIPFKIIDSMTSRHKGWRSSGQIFKHIFFNENVNILIEIGQIYSWEYRTHCFWKRPGANQATSFQWSQRWLTPMTHKWVNQPQWVDNNIMTVREWPHQCRAYYLISMSTWNRTNLDCGWSHRELFVIIWSVHNIPHHYLLT